MTVIARRKGGIWIMYAFLILIGAVFASMGRYRLGAYGYVMGGVLAIVGVYELVDYLLVPSVLVRLEGDCRLHFPKGIILDAKDITNVSYRRASARGIQYKWGTVIVSTHTDEIRLRFVEDCEQVEKSLTELMYKRRAELEEFPSD